MKNDEYMQSRFELLAAIRKTVGVGIIMAGVNTMMNGYENDDDEAKKQGIQQILEGNSRLAFSVFNNFSDYERYLKKNSDNEISKIE